MPAAERTDTAAAGGLRTGRLARDHHLWLALPITGGGTVFLKPRKLHPQPEADPAQDETKQQQAAEGQP